MKTILAVQSDGSTDVYDVSYAQSPTIMDIPTAKAQTAALVLLVDADAGTTAILKNRWGPTSGMPTKSAQVTPGHPPCTIHFDKWQDMRAQGVEPWVGSLSSPTLELNGVKSLQRHSVGTASMTPGGPSGVSYRYLIETMDGKRFSLLKRAYVSLCDAIDCVARGEAKTTKFTVSRKNFGPTPVIATYDVTYEKLKVSTAQPSSHCSGYAVKATMKAGVCVCPIKDLASTGHNAGCPEKR